MKSATLLSHRKNNISVPKKDSLIKRVFAQKYLFLMSFPFVIWVFIFSYVPLFGWILSFLNYKPGRPLASQQWVGLQNFVEFLSDPQFFLALRNTLAMSLLSLVCHFTFPIIFAIFLNEIRNAAFKRTIQTVSYLPHFVSWVVVAGIITKMLAADGVINLILTGLGIAEKPIQFTAMPQLFWWIVAAADLWKEIGWNSIIYLAAITTIDPQLYEAAGMDGAGRFKKMWYITLPGIRTTFIMLLIMAVGWLFSIGFEKQMLLGNSLVQDYSLVIDLYVLKYGLNMGRWSFGTAVGMTNSIISILLVLLANRMAKKYNSTSLI